MGRPWGRWYNCRVAKAFHFLHCSSATRFFPEMEKIHFWKRATRDGIIVSLFKEKCPRGTAVATGLSLSCLSQEKSLHTSYRTALNFF